MTAAVVTAAVWVVLSVPVALLIGRVIAVADKAERAR